MKKTNKASIALDMKDELKIGQSARGTMLRKGMLEFVFTENDWEGRRRSVQVHHSANLRIVYNPDGYYRINIKLAKGMIHNGASAFIRDRAEKAIAFLEGKHEPAQMKLGLVIVDKVA